MDALAGFADLEVLDLSYTPVPDIGFLKDADILISMDGKGRWVDNVFVERLWRSLKYEEVYLKAYDTVAEARLSIGNYFRFYNRERRHQGLDRQTPDQVYEGSLMWPVAA